MAKINERIKECRLANGKTLLEVANYLGVKEATAQRYESGEIKNIKHETIILLAHYFHCTPSYLMGWDTSNTETAINTLTETEKQIINAYRNADNIGKECVLRTLNIKEADLN